mmetsp:Transcript_2815/g.4801  ORF Transcript_2815/g.4801 Transcript_2815/m.4801 type:complete len:207 (-) Transcript_2815:553-1173(-)
MDRGTRDAGAVEVVGQPLALSLRPGEDQGLAIAVPVHESGLLEDLDDGPLLAVAVDDLDLLDDILVALKLVAVSDHDLVRVIQDVRGEVAYLPWPCRSEEHGVTIPRNPRQNFSNLGLKTHVKHAIGLVQHEAHDAVEADLTAFKEVVQPAGTRHDGVNAIAVLPALVSLGSPAVHGHYIEADASAKALSLLLRLLRQLTRGGHDQ